MVCSSFLQTEILLLGGRREVYKTQKANGIDKDQGTQKVTGFARHGNLQLLSSLSCEEWS